MKTSFVLITAVVGLFSLPGIAAEGNVRLAALMRGLSTDAKIVTAPLKAPVVAEVTDTTILDAMMRTRSVRFFLKEFGAKVGSVQDGKLVKNELTPLSIENLAGTELTDALAKITSLIEQLTQKYAQAETAYQAELAKAAADRNFAATALPLKEAQALQKEAHTLFN